ncbi:siroheme synthase [Phenylobacterium sp. Root77]|uniref:NAD(P)-dependent oxidoreductase n=1 Tax=unclassified Phenylobacterium TaxID=2640670 RepID=UPI0006FA6228|nr:MULTISPECIES: NAD(P)-dependent oxidoreductase [unclassified Phenylobacterium]KQW69459.1 siroheme synthase [Phenylobacterium sp. Root1277]KQW95175.1 siroheme synthase [Phenylobacterium sp. Root1290]KRC40966.1 siroheme synthase [Phenylobacterium sp. Root77]
MDAFPAFFPLSGRTVVIAGSGEAAEAKLRLLEGSPARIVRLEGPEAALAQSYAGAALAFVASADEAFVQAAAAAARAAHVPVNVVDRPQLCDFTTPAVIDRGEVVAAIGTGGASPMLATMLRTDIEQRVPEGAGRVAALFRQLQDEVRAALPQLHERRAFLREALAGPAASAAMAGDMDGATRLLREALAGGLAAQGRVRIVSGRGPADLLTLRATRALAGADVIVADPDADPAILSLARRDAERLDPADATSERLAALCASGMTIVRVTTAPLAPALLAGLERAGVAIEVLPTAAP